MTRKLKGYMLPGRLLWTVRIFHPNPVGGGFQAMLLPRLLKG